MSGGRFDTEFSTFLRALKQRSDIIEVVRSYVALDRKGGNYWACCPFHHEKTPSFPLAKGSSFITVSAVKNRATLSSSYKRLNRRTLWVR